MAQLKDLIVNGHTRVIGSLFANEVKIDDIIISGNSVLGTATANSNNLLTLNGHMVINPSYNATNSYSEGIRINRDSNAWSTITLGGDIDSITGTNSKSWLIGDYDGTLYISVNGSNSAATRLQGNSNGFIAYPRMGINGSHNSYNFYVNGASLFNGSINLTSGSYINFVGTKATTSMIRFIDNTSDAYGNGISIGGGGVTVIGAGESSSSLSVSGGAKALYLLSDGAINIESNANTIGDRIGFQVTTNGHIVPVKAEVVNNNAQNIGSSDACWSNAYVNHVHAPYLSSSSTLYIDSGNGTSILFRKAESEMARFNSSGNFIVGAPSNPNDITSYKLYVNGASYFNGNTTHNGIDYFANGTTYYINNSGTANLNAITANGVLRAIVGCNFITHGNEFNFIPTLSSNMGVWFNYRQTGGNNTSGYKITEYNFGDGASGTLASITNGQFSGNAATATTADYLSAYNGDEINFKTSDGNQKSAFYFNYRSGVTNAAATTAITRYYFCNGNATSASMTSGVRIYAEVFDGKATALLLNYCNDTSSSTMNSGIWNTVKNGTASSTRQVNKVNFYTVYNTSIGPSTYGEVLEILSYNDNCWQPQLWFGAGKTGHLYYRNKNYNDDSWGDWRTVLDSGNYTDYTVTKTGTGASGSWGISVTGSSATATKLATARTIAIETGATGTATSFDGSSNITIPITSVKEAYLTWGGQNFSASFSPIDAAMVGKLGANRLEFAKAEGITIEYTRNGGTTWTDYGSTDVQKTGLFSSVGYYHAIGKADSTNKATSNGENYKLRVTLRTDLAHVYTILNKFIIYISTNGSNSCTCTIKARTKANFDSGTNTWVTIADKVGISGWNGYNVINIPNLTTYGNTNTQYVQIQFLFEANGGNTDYYGLSIHSIMGYGGVGWTTPSNMASTGHLYSYDQSQNATFPANVSVTNKLTVGGKMVVANYGTTLPSTGVEGQLFYKII